MRKQLLYFFLFVSSIGFAQEFQEKHQRAQINYSSIEDLYRLERLGLSIDHGVHKKGHFIISDFSVSEIELARIEGFHVEVLIEDSKEYFLQQNRANLPLIENASCNSGGTNYDTPANFQLGSMGGYLTYQELLDQLDLMQSTYPNLITAKANISNFLTQGTPDNSVTPSIGGNGIKWVKISDNPNISEGEPQILYTSIHHAREPASLSQLVFYMWYLLENYDSDAEIKSIVDNTELYFVPVVNPDGYLYNEKTDPNGGGFWRKNRKNTHGVDNNRNYNYFIGGDPNNGVWSGPGSSSNTNSEIYHGPAPFSEEENQAIKWLVENNNFVMAFNNHTSGQLLYYPHAYANVPTPEEALFQGISSELVSQNGYFNLRDSPFSGDSDDFMYGTVGTHNKIYAFTPEIGTSFWPPSNQIESISKGMMYLNVTAAKMVNNYATVEETSPLFVGGNLNTQATFDIKRLGVGGNGTFTVNVNPISANIVFVGGGSVFSAMEVLEEDNGSINYTVAGVAPGDDIVFELVVNNGSFDTTIVVNKKFGEPTAVFEDPGNSVSTNFNNNGWATTTSTFVSPSSCITESPGGNYSNNANETITLKDPIDLTDAVGANVTFYAKWEIENNWDYTQFEISIDGGANWIPQCGKFTNEGSTNAGQPTGEPLYDGVENNWVLEEIDLSDYLGETILARFQFRSDGGQRADGFYFDDLKVNIVEEGSLGIADNFSSQFNIHPNPVRNLLNIDTVLNTYNIEVYNLQGQLITRSTANSGSKTIDYSGYTSGIYLMKLTSETASHTFKIVKE